VGIDGAMITIGIDIGLTGAIGATDSRGTASVRDMPTIPDGKPRKVIRSGKASTVQPLRIDGRALLLLVRELVPPGAVAQIVFEDVRARPQGNDDSHGNSMHSQGSLMRSRGIVEAVADITRFPVHAVQPQTWTRHFGLLKTKKGSSLEKARALFPSVAGDLKRVKDHNRAESLLIAHYGAQVLA
jgi:crossover junction endodeoxyribonuclease RuvC